MSCDQRSSERRRALIGARAIYNDGRSTIDCQIRNLSETGAQISLDETVILPLQFLLSAPTKQVTYMVELRWRSHRSAGIKFLDETNHKAPEASRALRATVDELRTENIQLRQENRELRKRLAALGFSSAG